MTESPKGKKTQPEQTPIVREQISGVDAGCLRGVLVFIGLFVLFGLILFVMSQI